MEEITKKDLKKLYRPPKDSHKGQNGKLCIIGGSRLFHGASLWALKVASRIVDMVYYSSIPENNKIAEKLKSQIFDFICVSRKELKDYIEESDAVLIGPGMIRAKETEQITRKLLLAFPKKKWIIDAGSLQMMDKDWLKELPNVIITPHKKEFERLFGMKITNDPFDNTQGHPERSRMDEKLATQKTQKNIENTENSVFSEKFSVLSVAEKVFEQAKRHGCVIVLKGPTDIVCSPKKCVYNTTGNEGMTKGGTGDVLAGLIAALACKNDLFASASAGIYVNGLAGDQLYQKVGPFFNASDLCDEVQKVLKGVIGYNIKV